MATKKTKKTKGGACDVDSLATAIRDDLRKTVAERYASMAAESGMCLRCFADMMSTVLGVVGDEIYDSVIAKLEDDVERAEARIATLEGKAGNGKK